MFYGKGNNFKKDPFEDRADKRSVFYYFFEKGYDIGFEMYLVMGFEKYLGKLEFVRPLLFHRNKNEFKSLDEKIKADAVLDRSGGTTFPPEDISNKVLNGRRFKLLCWDKISMYEYLSGFCPESYGVRSISEFKNKLTFFNDNKLVVLKPARGMKGKGIKINSPRKIAQIKNINFNSGWVLQKFIDTSDGIPGLVKGTHDLRIAIVNGKIVFSHIRQPAAGSKIANVAQGGSIDELSISDIPKSIARVAKKIMAMIDKDFDKPLYSIDFGIGEKGPVVFEINDTIGFPSSRMANSKKFIAETLRALGLRANR